MRDRLFTSSYWAILLANFLLFMGFWLLIPILPFYLSETFQASHSMVGLVLSIYTLSALLIRPFGGFLLDTFARKPLYLAAYFIFTATFVGYLLAGSLTLFILCRIVHGLSFGMTTVGGNTIVIDIMPSSRRGEGLGYYGLTNNIAMSIGPMIGLFMYDAHVSYTYIFLTSLTTCFLGLCCTFFIRTQPKPSVKHEPISLDRFFLLKGIPGGICLLMLSVPYGMTTNYIAMYNEEIGLGIPSGFFFTFMATGMAISRLFSGKQVDKGKVTQTISTGLYFIIAAFFLLASCKSIAQWSLPLCKALFLIIPAILGTGFGILFPAYNSLFVNLAPNSQRGTATSTYLTSWDVGIGAGMLSGGYISEISTFQAAYAFGAMLTLIAYFLFKYKVTPHYNTNHLQ